LLFQPGFQIGRTAGQHGGGMGTGCITLLTDFGMRDGNVGVMKGVIWNIAPQAQIADLSHFVGAQDIRQAAYLLGRSAPYFAPGTVHLVVVDPGVGTARRPIAGQIAGHYFVGPDNGVCSRLLDRADRQGQAASWVCLTQREFWLAEVSDVFHGRDIFAPVAAHLANGEQLVDLGPSIDDPIRLPFPEPQPIAGGWSCEVVYVDHFGNVVTSLERRHLGAAGRVTLRLQGETIYGLERTFGEQPAGTLIALYSSTDELIVSEVQGSAARRLGAEIGDRVQVEVA
jgi:S-adenosyl-L-methionine hydrolase (adenosine-forming)